MASILIVRAGSGITDYMPSKAGIYYSISGGGQLSCPPVVLIHGAGSNHLCWPAELRRLSGFRVLAIDLPGHGRSDGTAQQFIGGYAAGLTNFLESLGIYQSILVGHSMGGAVALHIALNEPNRVAALGLIASGAHLAIPDELMEEISSPALAPMALDWLRKRLFGPAAGDNLVERVVGGLKEARPGVLYSDWQACARFDARPQIAGLHAPLWVAAGMDDQLVPLSSSQFVANHAPRAQFQLVPNAGHMLILEQPRLLGQGLLAFLQKHFFC